MLNCIKSRLSHVAKIRFGIAILCIFLLPAIGNAAVFPEESLNDIGLKAYLYAYPMVLMETVRMTSGIPDNTLSHARSFNTPTDETVIRPNVDVLYTDLYLNLSHGPVTITFPAMGNRFWIFQCMDWWTDTFADMGTRTSGGSAQTYTFVGPDYQEEIPEKNVNIIRAPTNRVWLFGRIYSSGTPGDLATVHALQNAIKLKGRSVPKHYNESAPTTVSGTAPQQSVSEMTAETFFETFVSALAINAPHQEDWPTVALLDSIGIVPGRHFNFSSLSSEVQAALTSAMTEAPPIIAGVAAPGALINGWHFTTMFTGSYGGASIPYRAYIAKVGLGANFPDDAIYPGSVGALNGATNNYTMHFDKGQFPPVNGFWSITLYDGNGNLVSNPINRYAIRSADVNSFVYNSDGSVDIYIQNTSPGSASQANWLPCPAGTFGLLLRMYWPNSGVLYGTSTWKMPAVVAAP